MDKRLVQTTIEQSEHLFANHDPQQVWDKLAELIRLMRPDHDIPTSRVIFDDAMRLFQGRYPGYSAIRTPYHDLPHTLDVLICAIRLMHAYHVGGKQWSNRDITLMLIAVLMHDIGYAQKTEEDTGDGTGAQFTINHIKRGLEFMLEFMVAHGISQDLVPQLKPMIACSDPFLPIAKISFPDAHTRLLGQILGTADLVGQMADRNYLEKLTGLYREFHEAKLGNYGSMHDLICKTPEFHRMIQTRLDDEFGRAYDKFPLHFRETLGDARNYYMDSIELNLAYLTKLSQLGESECLEMLRRGHIVERNISALNSEKKH